MVKHQHYLTLFLQPVPLEIMIVDNLGLSVRRRNDNHNFLLIAYHHSKVTGQSLLRRCQYFFAMIMFDNCIMLYGILSYLLDDDGPQFFATLSEKLSLDLKIEHITSTVYHPRTNQEAEHYNRTFSARLCHYF